MTVNSERKHLLNQLKLERAKFEEVMSRWLQRDRNDQEIIEDWTIKDIVAHITTWEIELMRWLKRASLGKPPGIPAPGQWFDFTERINRQTHEDNRTHTLDYVLIRFNQVFDQLLVELKALPEDPGHAYWSVWLGGKPPWDLFATYPEHYREHCLQIEARLNERQEPA
jgi:hypothetical protein